MKILQYIAVTAALMLTGTVSTRAQDVTYNHDATKMNQFTMQEIGTGSFQSDSEWYYDLFHGSYKNSLLSTNKQLYRTATYQGSYSQVAYADSIRKRLEDRAKQEEFNIADRSVDVSWLTEQSKIENALMKFRNNLSSLAACRTSSEEQQDWQLYPKMWDFAIDRARSAYMANSERQKEFLLIYNDIVSKNVKLVKRIRYLKALNGSQDVANAQPKKRTRFTEAATASYNRWREAAWTANNTHTR